MAIIPTVLSSLLSIFGSVFYFGTGFHGIHVMVGHVFLSCNLYLMVNGCVSRYDCTSFEMAIMYWHFVDIVWLFLYVFIYLWSFGY